MPWPKGRKQSAEHRAKNSKALKGRPFTKEHLGRVITANRLRLLGKKRPDLTGENSPVWKGDVTYEGGYRYVADETGRRRREHVLIAEKALGRRLKKGEVVHHINGDKADNRKQNLLIGTQAYHKFIEGRMAQLYAREHFGGSR